MISLVYTLLTALGSEYTFLLKDCVKSAVTLNTVLYCSWFVNSELLLDHLYYHALSIKRNSRLILLSRFFLILARNIYCEGKRDTLSSAKRDLKSSSARLMKCLKTTRFIFTDSLNFTYPSLVPISRETHGGEDVAVFAHGPHSHLFTGHYEQNFIPHALAYAACIGPQLTACG